MTLKKVSLGLDLQDSLTIALPADPIKDNTRRQVHNAAYSWVNPTPTASPEMICTSKEAADLLGLDDDQLASQAFKNVFSGNAILSNARPYALCYGGHQFGHWAGQLGDGRAINIGEVLHNNNRWAMQLKGAGPTPYSRTADGRAVLRSSVREFLCSEAMHHLGVPTTRALSIAITGDNVLRDIMYDGNAAYEKGAVVCRLSPSFLRFGNYEIFAARKDVDNLRKLVDYTIAYFYPELGKPGKETYIQFFQTVADRTMDMIIHWQRIGFVHGVMNTDNMSILGLTIDYGPYGWLEGYDENWTPNTTDRQHKRYRYGNQAHISLWNLLKLANALFFLIEDVAPLEAILGDYQKKYKTEELKMWRNKLGLKKVETTDSILVTELKETLQLTETDMTIFFRSLSTLSEKELSQKDNLPEVLMDAFYDKEAYNSEIKKEWLSWWAKYTGRLLLEDTDAEQRKKQMQTVNPKYVLRNYMAQLVIDDADKGNYQPLKEMLEMLKKPYVDDTRYDKWYAKRPEWARNKVGCSMLSCSS